MYVIVLVLAVVGAVRRGHLPGVAIALLVPLGWAAATLPLVEANLRYHVPFDTLMCVLAGAAFADPAKAGAWMLSSWRQLPLRLRGVVARGSAHPRDVALAAVGTVGTVWALTRLDVWPRLAFWNWPGTAAASWLVLAVVAVLTVRVLLAYGPAGLHRLAVAVDHNPRRAAGIALAGVAVVIAGGAFLVSTANAMLSDVATVAPQGWQRYEKNASGDREGLRLTLVSSEVPAHLRQVSYPDAVRLNFDDTPQPGAVVGLVRTLDDLDVGERYRFYLQVYDPGLAGDPDDSLTISINGMAIWERAPGTGEQPGWHGVTIEFDASRPEATIRVERTAGSAPSTADAAVPAVRNLHLFPRYYTRSG